MEIRHVVISGSGVLKEKIKDLLSHSSVKITESDYHFLQADLVIRIDSGLEEPERAVFQIADRQAKEDAIFAATASDGITRLASAIRRPSRFLGLNFVFNPFQNNKSVVQVVKGIETAPEVVEACKAFLSKTSAVMIEVQDVPGLVLDRVLATVINEAATMHVTGVADILDIDKVAKSCLNWPAGPFEMADTIGLDRVLSMLEVLSREEGPRFIPCRLLKQKVAMGQLGRKTGKGFYSY